MDTTNVSLDKSLPDSHHLLNTTEIIYKNLNIGRVSKAIINDIKWIIYNSIKYQIIYFEMNIEDFYYYVIKRSISFFGFKEIHANEIFVFLANNIHLISTINFTLCDLIVFEYYGYFSEDIKYHIYLLLRNSNISILHEMNPNYEYALKLRNLLSQYYHNEEGLDILVVYIMWINNYQHIEINDLSVFISDIINNRPILKYYSSINNKKDLKDILKNINYNIITQSFL